MLANDSLRRGCYWLPCLLWLCLCGAGAQAAQYGSEVGPADKQLWRATNFEHFSVEQGLSQSTGLCLLQDRQGFIWIGTQDGLNKFDGYSFKVYRHDDADPGSIADNYILSLYEDRAGVLWVGTNKGGLNRFDARTERFTRYVHDPHDSHSLSLNAVNMIGEDHSGWLWVATDGGGFNRFDRQTGKFTRFIHDPTIPDNRRLNIVNALYCDKRGALWLGTSLGLSRIDLRTNEVQRFVPDPRDPYSLSHNRVQAITEDHTGALWVGTPEGLNRLDRQTRRFMRFLSDHRNPTSLSHNNIQSLYTDRAGTVWVGTLQGLCRHDDATGRFTCFTSEPGNAASLRTNKVLAIYEDRGGMLWVSTQDGGLNRFDRKQKLFTTFAHDPQRPHSLGHKVVTTFGEDQAGTLWVGTGGGLDQFNYASGQFTRYPLGAPGPQRARALVMAIREDRAGRLWVGAGGKLYRVERAARQFKQFAHDPQNSQSLGAGSVLALCEDQAGLLWIGLHGGGLNRFDPATEQFTRFVNDPKDPHSLSDNLVYTVYEDRAGALWVGTDHGLNRFDRTTGRFTQFVNDPRNPHSLSYNLVWSIYEDRAGRLWVGTGGGLNQFDRHTQQFIRYTEKDGLPNNNVMGILEDDHGRLWLGTVKGIARFDPQTKIFRNYDLTDRLHGNEVGQGAYYKNSRGEMFFGGPEGFSAFHPDHIKDDLDPPPVVITACWRYNTDDAEGVAVREPGIAAKSEIVFSYKDNIISFEFAALSFRRPEKNQYAYQLEGYSDKWIQLGAKRDLTFTNLDPGVYTLRVRGSNSDGIWNTTGASLRIIIVPPFWQRWWFVGLEVVAVIGLAVVAYRWRIRALERRHEQQQAFARQLIESQEGERKRIAAELHDSLGQHLVVIKNLALMLLQTPAHDGARQQIEDISATTSQAISEVKEISYNLRPYQLDRIGLTKAIEALLKKAETASGVRFQAELDDLQDALPKADEINFYRIVQECVNNIIKHSEATEATLSIHRHERQLRMKMLDNGQGFAPGATTGDVAKGGFGLIGIAERAQLLGGQAVIHSAPGQGTMINLEIELNRGGARNNGR